MDWNASTDGAFSDLFSKRNLFLLVSFWLGGLAILVAYGTSPSNPAGRIPAVAESPVSPESGSGAFVASRRRADARRPAYRVACDDLNIENGRLGWFRTASHQVIQITNLRVTFSPESSGPGRREGLTAGLGDFFSLFAPQSGSGGAGTPGLLHDLQGPEQAFSMYFEPSDTTEVHIRGLHWEIRRDGVSVFETRCRHARLESGSFDIVLRGHATVTAKGATLESNCLTLDARNDFIIANGPYCLTQARNKTFGAGACFDMALKVVDTGS
jgi:hypothetical protein